VTLLAESVATPFVTHNRLLPQSRADAAALLNKRLADAIDLEAQCKMAHWNVKGPQFIALHKLFDEVHAGVGEYTDMIAERVVQLGGTAEGSLRIASQRSELDEYPSEISAGPDHVRQLATAIAAFSGLMGAAMKRMDELEDPGSSDLCVEVLRGLDKWLWFVEAHAQSR
jgi:starvation-inducible DNA-binding protein